MIGHRTYLTPRPVITTTPHVDHIHAVLKRRRELGIDPPLVRTNLCEELLRAA